MKHGTATHPQPKAVAINMVWVSRKSAADISQHEAVGKKNASVHRNYNNLATLLLKQSKANFVNNEWNLDDEVNVRSCCWTERLDASKVMFKT